MSVLSDKSRRIALTTDSGSSLREDCLEEVGLEEFPVTSVAAVLISGNPIPPAKMLVKTRAAKIC
jgi:hypothetical protein